MAAQRSAWIYYPWAVVAALGVVVVVNGGMVWASLSTFPGIAIDDSFDHSNEYDRILATAAHEAKLGWQLGATAPDGHAVLTLADANGQSIGHARISGRAVRPLGPDEALPLTFRETAPGRYVADQVLSARGQWELRVVVSQDAETLHAAPRVLVR